MPRYKCHKEVWALKIKTIMYGRDHNLMPIDGCEITPEDPRFVPFVMPLAWYEKHMPKAGNYFVLYKDGYQSYSPASEFEDGYTLTE